MFEITKKVWEYKASKQRVYPCRSNRASVIGHPCERYLVYMRTSWEKMELPEVTREFIFEGGRLIEDMAIRELKDAGFEITNQGRDFEDKRFQLTGHVDAFISKKTDDPQSSLRVPIEIKGISPFDFDKIHTIEDMTKSDKPWTRGYPAQLQLYLFLANKEEGLFYIKNKLTYQPKEIWAKLDYEYCEQLLKRCERINNYIKTETLPDQINDYKTCKTCQAKLFCRPGIVFGEGIGFLDDKEMITALERRDEIIGPALEYNSLDKELKERLKNYMKDRFILAVGTWLIEKKISKNGSVRFDITKDGQK